MKNAFWGLAAVVIGLAAYFQHMPDANARTNKILATGMAPQIALIGEVVSDNGWAIECEGNSGGMTVVRIAPKGLPSAALFEDLWSELTPIATTLTSSSDLDDARCNLPPDHFRLHIDETDDEIIVEVGTPASLRPLLRLADSCEVRGARLSPLTSEQRANSDEELPADWVGLILDPSLESRTGPIACFSMLSIRASN